MKTKLTIILSILFAITFAQPNAIDILKKIDQNMSSDNRVFESQMTIHGKRNSRTITSRSYSVGDKKAFTEYLSPARDQGTKMLKLVDQLWIYSPSTDRIIQISGHMLRESVMGSDLSYEDMMDDRKLTDIYNAKVVETTLLDGRNVWVIELDAKTDNLAYAKRKMWVDTERFVPLKEDLFAKSGQLLKQSVMSDVINIDGRWFPTKIVYKDMLKDGNGTEFKITNIKFNQNIQEHMFSKAALKQ